MNTYTILGFVAEGEGYCDFNFDIFAESPMDAIEKILRKHSNLIVSSVCRSNSDRLIYY